MPSLSAIRCARSGFERPAKSISRFCGPRSIHGLRSSTGRTGSTVSRPGSVASAILPPLPPDVAFFVLLPRPRDCEGFRRDILRDDRSGPNPSIVANLDGRNKRIVDAGPDVAADLGAALWLPLLVGKVGSDVASADVGSLADVRVADVRLVRRFDACAEAGVLDLHERARFGTGLQHRSGAKVKEGTNERIGADLGVDDYRVRSDVRAPGDARLAAEERERLDRRVRLELDRRIDPSGARIDDRHPGEHVRLVDAVSGLRRGRRQLHARGDADLNVVAGLEDGHAFAPADELPHGVGEIELALAVLGSELLESRPELLRSEDIDRGVDLRDRALLVERVAGLDDRLERAVPAADDAPVVASID